MELGEKREVFLEVYGYGNKGECPQHHADARLAYYPCRDVNTGSVRRHWFISRSARVFYIYWYVFPVKAVAWV
jgi:hypothetical protein